MKNLKILALIGLLLLQPSQAFSAKDVHYRPNLYPVSSECALFTSADEGKAAASAQQVEYQCTELLTVADAPDAFSTPLAPVGEGFYQCGYRSLSAPTGSPATFRVFSAANSPNFIASANTRGGGKVYEIVQYRWVRFLADPTKIQKDPCNNGGFIKANTPISDGTNCQFYYCKGGCRMVTDREGRTFYQC